MYSDFLSSSEYVIALECLSPKKLAPKGERRKMKQGICAGTLNPLEVASAGEGGASKNGMMVTQLATHFYVFTSAVRSSNRSEHISSAFGEQRFTQVPTNCMHAVPGTHAQQPATGQRYWGGG